MNQHLITAYIAALERMMLRIRIVKIIILVLLCIAIILNIYYFLA